MLKLRHPLQYALSSCMANRFKLEQEDGFTVAHFGLINGGGSMIDRFTCILPEHALKAQKENLAQYSDKVGLPKVELPKWNPPPRTGDQALLTIPVVDFIHLAHWENRYAEICFWNYSQGHLSDIVAAGSDEVVTPFGVGLVRCTLDLQRAFLAELCEVIK